MPLELNSIRCIMATLLTPDGTTEGRQDPEEEEKSDGAPEPTTGSPTPLSLGATGDGDSEGMTYASGFRLTLCSRGLLRAFAVRQDYRYAASFCSPVPSSVGGHTADSFSGSIFGWEMMLCFAVLFVGGDVCSGSPCLRPPSSTRRS
ncbi:hypothetical protein ACSSS7_001215 [Eimeria intestinalis]